MVRLDDVPLTDAKLRQIRRRLGYVIQSGGLFPHLTVSDNLPTPPGSCSHAHTGANRPGSPILALFLYSLLPIVRGVGTGLRDIDPALIDSAVVLGLTARVRLLRVELPLAARSVLAGIKTAAVLNVGFATLGALVVQGLFDLSERWAVSPGLRATLDRA